MVEAIEASVGDTQWARTILESMKDCVSWMGVNAPDGIQQYISECGDCGYPRDILRACAVFLERTGASRKDHDMAVMKNDGYNNPDPKIVCRAQKIIVILEDLRSVFNVGSIFRTAECLSLGGIWLCGITPTPQNPVLGRTAMGTAGKVAWRTQPNAITAVREAQTAGYYVVAIETVEDATLVFESRYQVPLALVLGNESLGISDEVLEACDDIVSIPVLGWKNSLNVGVAFGVAAYQVVFGAQENTHDK